MSRGAGAPRIAFLERRHPAGHRGAIADALIPLLRGRGADVAVVHAEHGAHRLDERPPWDAVVLKSGSAAALHVAAGAEAWGIPCVNTAEATRLAQDRLASAMILHREGLPVPVPRLAWLGARAADAQPVAVGAPAAAPGCSAGPPLKGLEDRPLIVKAARGSQGEGLWKVASGELRHVVDGLPEGPYLVMDWVPHTGHDLKVFVAGTWMAAIERPFPAHTLEQKRGRAVALPAAVREATARAGRLLGLSAYGCDWVFGEGGWSLVDVNAFPGFKGADGAGVALADTIMGVARAGG